MKKKYKFIFISICLAGCFENKQKIGVYPVIDVVNNISNYQRVYCSDFFSSLEIIPLETNKNILVGGDPFILANDSLIFVCSTIAQNILPPLRNVLVFNRSGKFLNQIGEIGGGPGEYFGISSFFLNHENSTVFIEDGLNIFEYEFNGKFIGSFSLPRIDGHRLGEFSYLEKNLFIGSISYYFGYRQKYFVFDRNGDIVKGYPGNYIYNHSSNLRNLLLSSLNPIRMDNQLFLKDHVNDTLYTLVNMNLQPVYVFNFGQYTYPLGEINKEGQREIIPLDVAGSSAIMRVQEMVGTPKYFFYSIFVPSILPRPKTKPTFRFGRESSTDNIVHCIFDIVSGANILLNTDLYHQKGINNDINGGLPFFPKYYVGNDVVVDIWQADYMKEMLTEEYFASQRIKDQHAHKKLKELLKHLKYDDNPVVVIAKLK